MKLDIKGIIFIAIIVLIAVYLKGAPVIFGVVFGIVMYLMVYKLGDKIGGKLLDIDYQMFLAQKKIGSKEAIILKEQYKRKHEGFSGALSIALAITWVSFGLMLLFMKIFLGQVANVLQGTQSIDTTVIAFVLLAGVIGSLVSPLAVPYWVFQGSRVRIFDKKHIYLLPPGSKVRSILRAGFGTGNLAVILYAFWAIMSSASDLLQGFQLALGIFIFSFGSIGFGGLLAGSLITWRNRELFNKELERYESKYMNIALSSDEFLSIIEDAIERPEQPEVKVEESQEIGEGIEKVSEALEEQESEITKEEKEHTTDSGSNEEIKEEKS